MSKAFNLIESSILNAKQSGLKIVRRPLFIFNDSLIACNGLGSVLIEMQLHNNFKLNFPDNWLMQICNYLEEDISWVCRFVNGFDYGNVLTIIKTKNDKEIKERDIISAYANKLALRLIS